MISFLSFIEFEVLIGQTKSRWKSLACGLLLFLITGFNFQCKYNALFLWYNAFGCEYCIINANLWIGAPSSSTHSLQGLRGGVCAFVAKADWDGHEATPDRLLLKLMEMEDEKNAEQDRVVWMNHNLLERGNPVKIFKGNLWRFYG